MKKIFFLSIILCIACSKVKPKKNYCLKKAEYFSNLDLLVPESSILLYIYDQDSLLQKKVNLENVRKIIFFAVKEEHRKIFHLVTPRIKSFKIEKSVVIVPVLTTYFRPDVFIDGVRSKNKWSSKQIQEIIENDIGLVFEKDTVVVKKCSCPR